MKKLILSLIFTLLFFQTQAQYIYPKTEKAKTALSKTLVVQIYDEDSDTEKFSNTAIKEVFDNNWTLSKVLYKTADEIEELKDAKDNQYTYLTHDAFSKSESRSGYISQNGRSTNLMMNAGSNANKYDYTAFSFAFYDFDIQIIEKNKIINVLSIGFANGELTKIDFLFLCQQTAGLLKSAAEGVAKNEYYNPQTSVDQIKSSKLLIQQDFFKEKDIKKMDDYYTSPYEMVNLQKIEDIVLNKTEGHSYIKIVWSHQHDTFVWLIIDTATGKTLSQTSFGGMRFGVRGVEFKANEIIKAKHLKYGISVGAQKMNNRHMK